MKVMYYKAEIIMHSEKIEYCDKTGTYLDADPDTLIDHGIVGTIIKPTLSELNDEIVKRYGVIHYDIDNRYYCHENTDLKQVPHLETYYFYITHVVETEIKF